MKAFSLPALGAALVLLTSATTSVAIPMAGDYEWTSGELTGTFTSTGTELLDWSFETGNGTTFSTADGGVAQNDVDLFAQFYLPTPTAGAEVSLIIEWNGAELTEIVQDWAADPDGGSTSTASIASAPSVNVSEPAAAALLALGLIGAGFARKRRT